MPFTFSHPAIVFPLRWIGPGWTSLTGLVVGSVVPDFEKFLKMGPQNTFSHTWHGIFWFNLPLGIILCFVFHQLVRDPLIENLPEFLRKRLCRFRAFNWHAHFKAHYGVVAFSIILGAFSHIAWDDLTHRNGKIVQRVPFLWKTVHLGDSVSMQLWSFLDLFSTIGGAVFILFVVLYLPVVKVSARKSLPKVSFWFLWLLLALLVTSLRFMGSLGSMEFWEPVIERDLGSDEFWEFLFTSISACLVSLLLSSVLYKYRKV